MNTMTNTKNSDNNSLARLYNNIVDDNSALTAEDVGKSIPLLADNKELCEQIIKEAEESVSFDDFAITLVYAHYNDCCNPALTLTETDVYVCTLADLVAPGYNYSAQLAAAELKYAEEGYFDSMHEAICVGVTKALGDHVELWNNENDNVPSKTEQIEMFESCFEQAGYDAKIADILKFENRCERLARKVLSNDAEFESAYYNAYSREIPPALRDHYVTGNNAVIDATYSNSDLLRGGDAATLGKEDAVNDLDAYEPHSGKRDFKLIRESNGEYVTRVIREGRNGSEFRTGPEDEAERFTKGEAEVYAYRAEIELIISPVEDQA